MSSCIISLSLSQRHHREASYGCCKAESIVRSWWLQGNLTLTEECEGKYNERPRQDFIQHQKKLNLWHTNITNYNSVFVKSKPLGLHDDEEWIKNESRLIENGLKK